MGSGKVDVLHDATENGNVEIIKMLIDNGYPINDEALWNAASIACSAKNYDAFPNILSTKPVVITFYCFFSIR